MQPCFAISIKTSGNSHYFEEPLKTNHSDSFPFDHPIHLKDSSPLVNSSSSFRVGLIHPSLTPAYHPCCSSSCTPIAAMFPLHRDRPSIVLVHLHCYSPTSVFLSFSLCSTDFMIHNNHSLKKTLISFVLPFLLGIFTPQKTQT